MFGKLLAIVLALGVLALALLLERQRRYETTLEISKTHWRILDQERTLWRLRAELATHIRPAEIRAAVRSLDATWQPLPHRLDRSTPPTAPRLATGAERPPGAAVAAPEFGG